MLALVLASEQPQGGSLQDLLDAGRRYRGLTMEQLESVVADLGPKVAQLADVFSFSTADLPDYAAVLAAAHAQLGHVADDVAQEMVRQKSASACRRVIGRLSQAAEQLASRDGRWIDATSRASAASAGPPAVAPSSAAECGVAVGAHAAVASPAVSPAIASAAFAPQRAAADPGLVGRIEAAVASCRQSRRALSLVLFEIDRYGDVIVTRGLDGAAQVVRRLRLAVDRVCEPGDARYQIDDGQVALILEGCERSTAVDLAREVVRLIRGSHTRVTRSPNVVTVSGGVATLPLAPKNFPACELLEAAQRCLNGAHASGGDAVKSIDL
jgi:GGDEF domain-containing protein